jgi:DNA-binding NarL/FixJ family response regulator
MNKTRVLLADDHAIVRQGLRALIDAMPDAEVVAEAANGLDALAQALRHQPDVALLDIAMPELNGIETTERLLRDCPRTKVVMLSMHTSAQYVTAAVRAGALGYVVKDAAVDELAEALRAASLGRGYISTAVSGHLVQALRRPSSAEPGPQSLSDRQRQTLKMIAEGLSTRQIAERLGISPKTVETHRAELMRRLDIHDVAGLTRFALREGIVSDE